jgi:hypothetical protein
LAFIAFSVYLWRKPTIRLCGLFNSKNVMNEDTEITYEKLAEKLMANVLLENKEVSYNEAKKVIVSALTFLKDFSWEQSRYETHKDSQGIIDYI